MLDQNTDRMWFVIGAVIVGTAIIFIANGTLPEIFASVAQSFEKLSTLATDDIDDMFHYNLADPSRFRGRGATYEYNNTGVSEVSILTSGPLTYRGVRPRSGI